MKSNYFFLVFILLLGNFSFAQQAPFMVCNASGNTCAPYLDLTTAYNAAAAGDYIYLPAGDFSLGVQISKEIHFVGAGFDTNASITTGTTRISGDIIMDSSANGSSFEGFYLTGDFKNYGYLNAITFSYMNFNRTRPTNEGYAWTWSNCFIKNCVIREYLYLGSSPSGFGENNTIMNSMINSIHNLNHSVIKNCIISKYSTADYCFYNIKNTVIKNNVIGGQGFSPDATNTSENVTFLNNATVATSGQLANGKPFCTEFNTIYSISVADTFINSNTFIYDPTLDFHIKPTSAAHNAGDNGLDIGIYGGSTPWKDGSIPSNPHIFFKSIGSTTDGSGNLPVQIKVSAQN